MEYIIGVFMIGVANAATQKIFQQSFERTCKELEIMLDDLATGKDLHEQVPKLFHQLMQVELDSFSKPHISSLLYSLVNTIFLLSKLRNIPCETQVVPGEVCSTCVDSDKVWTLQGIISLVVEHKEWGDLFISAMEEKILKILENWDTQGPVLKNFISLSFESQKKTTLFFLRHISIEILLTMVSALRMDHIRDRQGLVKTVAGILLLTDKYNDFVKGVLFEVQCTLEFPELEPEENPGDVIFNDLTKGNSDLEENPLVREVLTKAFRISQEKPVSGNEEA